MPGILVPQALRGTSLRTARARAGLVATAVAAGTGADVAFDPSRRHVPLCPFHAMTGWWCPLCGGLRCVDSLVHGRLELALRDNALLVAAIPILLFALADTWWRQEHGWAARRWRRVHVVGLVAVLAVFTVVRNLPGLDALRPA